MIATDVAVPVAGPGPVAGPVPGTLRTGLALVRLELRGYLRAPDTVFFVFLFPVLMLGIFGTAFSAQGLIGALPDGTGGISIGAYYLPGMVAAGLLTSGMQNLAADVVREKSEGWLRRLGGTPVTPVAYFIGKAGMTLVMSIAQFAILLLFAIAAFGAHLPADAAAWGRFAWIFVLGIVTMSLLGVALSALPRSARSSTAVILPIVLVLQFISGVYLPFNNLPSWMQTASSAFPLRWLAAGMRSVFLPAQFADQEPGGVWNIGQIALGMGIWLIVGLVIARLTFRWVRRS
jgi:ABC-2 type transport system permease protein